MKITPKFNVKKFLQGGEMTAETPMEEAPVQEAPVEETAPAESQEDPMAMLMQAAMQALQSQDCQIAMQVCQALAQLGQLMQAPEETQGEPVFARNGAKLIVKKRIRK